VAKRLGGQAAEQAQEVRKTQCIKTWMAQGAFLVIRPTSWQKLAIRYTNACKDRKIRKQIRCQMSAFPQLPLFLVRFWAFLGKGGSKTPYTTNTNTFLQKVHVRVENFFQNNRQKKRSQFFFSTFFGFYRVSGCFSAMGVQKHNNNNNNNNKRFAKKSCRIFLDFFITFLAFPGEGSSKTRHF
jgi:hypothetical protein